MATILDKILAKKRAEVEALKAETGIDEFIARAKLAPMPRDFTDALRVRSRVPVIAEIKKKSPSAGELNGHIDVAARARRYQAGGASAISVLTDGPFFGGEIEDLALVRETVFLPVLRKDFLIDPVQVYQARGAGADAVLLIAAALDDRTLAELFGLTRDLGMAALVEVHNGEELDRALRLKPSLLGINNRDLATLEVSLETSLALRRRIPEGITVVAESGVSAPGEIRRLHKAGLDAFLVGTALMKANDPAALLKSLVEAGGRECYA